MELNYTAPEIAKRLLLKANTVKDYDKGRQGYDKRTGRPTREFERYCEQLEQVEPNTVDRGFKHRGPGLAFRRKVHKRRRRKRT